MWTEIAPGRRADATAENRAISLSFHLRGSTGRKAEDCYTFEHFARGCVVLRSTYYYHYKKSILGLKEEAQWS